MREYDVTSGFMRLGHVRWLPWLPDGLDPVVLLLRRVCRHAVHGVLALDDFAVAVRLAGLDEFGRRGVELEAVRLRPVKHRTHLKITPRIVQNCSKTHKNTQFYHFIKDRYPLWRFLIIINKKSLFC